MKHVTAFLAAGAVLLPHAAMAVSGGGGTLTEILCHMAGFSQRAQTFKVDSLSLQALVPHTIMRICLTRICVRMHTPKQNCVRQTLVAQT